jgi:hypothetical protein
MEGGEKMKSKIFILILAIFMLLPNIIFAESVALESTQIKPMTIVIDGKEVILNTITKDGQLFVSMEELAPAIHMELNQGHSKPMLKSKPIEITTAGKAELSYTAKLISNDSVGDEWSYSIKVNNNTYSSFNEKITIELDGDNIPVEFIASEYDKSKSDIGMNSIVLPYSEIIKGEALTFTKQVVVTENGGRYSGNSAIVEFTLRVNPL